jgi:ketosteroid isomerase-like protein
LNTSVAPESAENDDGVSGRCHGEVMTTTRLDTAAALAPAARAGVADPAALEARFSHFVRAGDLDGLVGLYAADAVVSLPHGREAAGHDAIRAAYAAALGAGATWGEPTSVRVIDTGELALTSSADAVGVVRTQVARRQADGTWVWARDGSHLRDEAPHPDGSVASSGAAVDLLGAA